MPCALRSYTMVPMSDGSRDGSKPGPDTRQAMASARTVPSGPLPEDIASAPTMSAGASEGPPRLSAGEVLGGGRYQLLEEVGRGGEGVVFRARDLKADAVVALKLLQQDEGSEQRLQRFRRELQMARKVTHPNVVRIYDLIELPGRFGLSMELVDGEALDVRLARGPMDVAEVSRLALDLARALAAAHQAGVTHRDLKPGNVLLRRDGSAVVTDFGVSRAHGEPAAPSSSPKKPTPLGMRLTREGAIVGTPQYMAPEQLEGRVDIGPAADVYAFGAVMFEAATGQRLHGEATTLEELHRMRSESPAPRVHELRRDLPPPLCAVIDRCLERAPGARFANGGAVLAALERPEGGAPRLASVAVASVGVAVAAVAAAAVWGTAHRKPLALPSAPATSGSSAPAPPTPPLAFHPTAMRRVTFGDSCEEFPSFTPDGRTMLYDGTVGRDSFIYSLDLDGGEPRQLTHVRGWDIAPSVSPKGDRFAFVRFAGAQVDAYVAPMDGSAPPMLLTRGAGRPSWSPDGRRVWAGSGETVGAYDVDTKVRVLALPDETGDNMHIELSNGSVLAWSAPAESGTGSRGLSLVPVRGPARWLIRSNLEEVLAVTPDERHALVSRHLDTGGVELLDVPVDGSPITSLAATGVMAFHGLSISRDGRRLAWSACREEPEAELARTWGGKLEPLGGDLVSVGAVAAIPGTSQVLVSSARLGKDTLWIADLKGHAAPKLVSTGDLIPNDAAVSGDGSRFAVTVGGSGLYVGRLQGEPQLRRLTGQPEDSSPQFRFGDRQIVFTRHEGGHTRVMSVPVDGGLATPLLEPDTDEASTSPVDDRLVYLAGSTHTDATLAIWDGRTGRHHPLSRALPAGRYEYPRFSLDGRRVTLVRGDTELVEVDVASGALVRTFSTETGDQLASPTYTREGLVVVRVHWKGNIWVADLAR